MGYCWRCFSEVDRKDRKCPACGFELELKVGNSRPRLEIPRKGDVDTSFSFLVKKSAEPYEKLAEILTNYRDNLERGLETKVEVDIWPFRDFRHFVETNIQKSHMRDELYIGFLNLSYQLKYLELKTQRNIVTELGRKNGSNDSMPHVEEFLTVFKGLQSSGKLDEDLKNRSQGNYSSIRDSIELREISENMVEEAIKSTAALELSKPFFKSLKTGKHDRFNAHLSHELTHTYLIRKFDYDWNKPVLKGMEEAACNVVTYIRYEAFFKFDDEGNFVSFAIDSYRKKRIPKSTLKISIRAFLNLLNDYEGDSPVDFIRKEASDAIERIQNNSSMSPAQAILQKDELEKEHKIYRDLEVAEYLCIHSFMLLDILDEQEAGNYKSWVHDAIEDSTPLNFSNGTMKIKKKDTEPLLKRDIELFEKARAELKELIQQQEGKKALNELYQNLDQLIEIIENEVKFLEKPFCPNCGMILKPEDNYCRNCGEKAGSGATDFSDGLENLLDETALSSHSFSSGEQKRKATLEEVIIAFEDLIGYGEKMNAVMLKTLEKLHSSEEDSARILQEINESGNLRKKYPELAQLIDTTEESYQVSMRVEKVLKKAGNAAERAHKEFEQIEK